MFRVKCSGYKSDKARRERHKTIYPGYFHNPEVVQSPCHLQEIFHYNQSDYNCSSTQTRDFVCPNTQARDFIYSSTQARDSYQRKITKKIVWIEHSIYNQRCS